MRRVPEVHKREADAGLGQKDRKAVCVLGVTQYMTSTHANEQAQHFCGKLGYQDEGCLFLDNTTFEQAPELLMIKVH